MKLHEGQRPQRTRLCRREVADGRTAMCRSCGDAVVAVVQTAELWRRDNKSGRRRRNRPRNRRVLVQREMRARVQVVRPRGLMCKRCTDRWSISRLFASSTLGREQPPGRPRDRTGRKADRSELPADDCPSTPICALLNSGAAISRGTVRSHTEVSLWLTSDHTRLRSVMRIWWRIRGLRRRPLARCATNFTSIA
jgi:hypothetical protein